MTAPAYDPARGPYGVGNGVEVRDNKPHRDMMYPECVRCCQQQNRVSAAMIQRRLHIGYSRAFALVEDMGNHGVTTGPDEQGVRKLKPEFTLELFGGTFDTDGENAQRRAEVATIRAETRARGGHEI